jgi:nudix-type nucleoside diphosphatase (YffH/AdpP family)
LSHRIFLYGTLCDPELFRIVSGLPFAARPASLPGASVRWVAEENFPVLVESDGLAAGVVAEVDDGARARLDFYELGFGYGVETREVTTPGGRETATVYVPETGRWPVGDAWSLADWQALHGDLARVAAEEYVRLFGVLETDAAARAFEQVRMRAASRLRAKAEPSPGIAPDVDAPEVVPERTAQPYTDYFAVREDWLAFPRFGGGKSPVVKRATFMGGDAVTVLPYDPKADTVLVVRQFRHGAFCRGDPNPWTLEPAAGRIDPGEMPEETAHRELLEETGVTASALHFVGRYYPSPGAYSEYLYSYVATADLAGRDRGVAGLVGEDEDIMAHVLPFGEAMALIEDGTINTGPLILSLGWLALNRERLRQG